MSWLFWFSYLIISAVFLVFACAFVSQVASFTGWECVKCQTSMIVSETCAQCDVGKREIAGPPMLHVLTASFGFHFCSSIFYVLPPACSPPQPREFVVCPWYDSVYLDDTVTMQVPSFGGWECVRCDKLNPDASANPNKTEGQLCASCADGRVLGNLTFSCFISSCHLFRCTCNGRVPMQSAFGKCLLCHKQRLYRWVEQKKWCWIESAYAKPICLLYFFAYQFSVTGNQAMWLLSE